MNPDLRFEARKAARLMQCEPIAIVRAGQVIEPDFPANGKGHRALYSFRNLVEIRLTECLGKFGIPQKRIQKYIEDLRKSRGQWLEYDGADGYVVLDNLWRWSAGHEIADAIKVLRETGIPPTGIISIDIGTIKRALRTEMEKITINIGDKNAE